MIRTQAKLRAWGNSIGVVLPKDELKAEHLRPDDKVEIVVTRKGNPLREAFGKLKFRTPTDELLKRADRELWSKY
ncbi:MAG: hypothetical protein R6U32_06885 [Candidatus Woesearchaeota archaeon]